MGRLYSTLRQDSIMPLDQCFGSDPGPHRNQKPLFLSRSPSDVEDDGCAFVSPDDPEMNVDGIDSEEQYKMPDRPILGSLTFGNGLGNCASPTLNHTNPEESDEPNNCREPNFGFRCNGYEPRAADTTESESHFQSGDFDLTSSSHQNNPLPIPQLDFSAFSNGSIEVEKEHAFLRGQGSLKPLALMISSNDLSSTPLHNSLDETSHPWPSTLPGAAMLSPSLASSESSSELSGPRKPPRRASTEENDTKYSKVNLGPTSTVKKGAFIVRSWPKNGFFKIPETRSQPEPSWRPGDGFSTGETRSRFPLIAIGKEKRRSSSPDITALPLDTRSYSSEFASLSNRKQMLMEGFKHWVLDQPRQQKEIWPTAGDFKAALAEVTRARRSSTGHRISQSKVQFEDTDLFKSKHRLLLSGFGDFENLRRSPIRRSNSAATSKSQRNLGKSLRFALESRSPPLGSHEEDKSSQQRSTEESLVTGNSEDDLNMSAFALRGKLAGGIQSLEKVFEHPSTRSIRCPKNLSGEGKKGDGMSHELQPSDITVGDQEDHIMLGQTREGCVSGDDMWNSSERSNEGIVWETQKIIPCSPGVLSPIEL